MPFFFGDSFDLYALPADALLGYWDSGTTGFSLGTGRFTGSRAATHSATGAWLVKSSGSNDATHHIVCAYQQTAAISGTTLGLYFQLTDGTTNQVCIVFRSDGAILLTSATPGGTALATYTGAVTAASTWYAFEFEVVINNTTGSFAVRKNGNTSNDFSATSLNTRPGTNAYANKLTVGSNAAVTGASFDDVLWRSDTTAPAWAGDIRCYARRPDTDASVSWTRSGAQQITVGSNTTASDATNTARYTSFVANGSGTIASIAVSFNAGFTGNCKMALFADSSGAPGAVLSSATTLVNPATGSNTFTFAAPVSVTRGTTYWFGISHDVTAVVSVNNNVSTARTSSVVTYASFPTGSPSTVGSQANAASTVFITTTINADFVSDTQQDATASYVYSSAPGAQDLYTLSGSTPSTVVGVITRGLLQKSDAGTRLAAVQLRSGSTTVQASGALGTSWGWLWRADTTDPATGAAWTSTGVAGTLIGAQVTG